MQHFAFDRIAMIYKYRTSTYLHDGCLPLKKFGAHVGLAGVSIVLLMWL